MMICHFWLPFTHGAHAFALVISCVILASPSSVTLHLHFFANRFKLIFFFFFCALMLTACLNQSIFLTGVYVYVSECVLHLFPLSTLIFFHSFSVHFLNRFTLFACTIALLCFHILFSSFSIFVLFVCPLLSVGGSCCCCCCSYALVLCAVMHHQCITCATTREMIRKLKALWCDHYSLRELSIHTKMAPCPVTTTTVPSPIIQLDALSFKQTQLHCSHFLLPHCRSRGCYITANYYPFGCI